MCEVVQNRVISHESVTKVLILPTNRFWTPTLFERGPHWDRNISYIFIQKVGGSPVYLSHSSVSFHGGSTSFHNCFYLGSNFCMSEGSEAVRFLFC